MWKIVLIFCLLVFINCGKPKQDDSERKVDVNKGNSTCNVGIFSESDTAGSVTGIVVTANDSGNGSHGVDITLRDKNMVERKFFTDYGNVGNLDFKKIVPGACLNVNYVTEIHKEEGEIVGREYFITKIDYL